MSPLILRTARAGFTAVELMITLAILAILIGVAAPGLRDFIYGVRLTGQANDLLTDLMMARSEAVKRDVAITVCSRQGNAKGGPTCRNNANWADGWVVVVDADADGQPDTGTLALRDADALDGKNTLVNASNGVIRFNPTGIAATGATTLTLCDKVRPQGYGRRIEVSAQGRASIKKIEPAAGNQSLCQ